MAPHWKHPPGQLIAFVIAFWPPFDMFMPVSLSLAINTPATGSLTNKINTMFCVENIQNNPPQRVKRFQIPPERLLKSENPYESYQRWSTSGRRLYIYSLVFTTLGVLIVQCDFGKVAGLFIGCCGVII